ncbi:DUF2971 domain-containing protein [Cupriavidus oxalaticus]|uniref:DUF2971 domain-containing protein n=1 Tax=Cupriavidus oxalaticus TaxID=96344 RepID=UPI00317C197F
MQEALIPPSTLFKYRDDSERTESIFKERKVWLSSPSQLNDPLECKTGEIPKAWEAATIRQLEEGQLMGMVGMPVQKFPATLFSLSERQTKRWWKRFRGLSHKQKVAAMRQLYADHGRDLSRPEAIFQDMRKRLKAVGVFSLSAAIDNELMWAHYGGNHFGIALGFGCAPDCKLTKPRHTLPVTYALEKPTFKTGFKNEVTFYAAPGGGTKSVGRVSFEDEVFRAAISTKTPVWNYEREWRYVEESSGLFDWPGPLVSVTFGLKMTPERRNYYRRLAEAAAGKDVRFFEVQLSKSLGGLIVNECK